MRFKPRFDAVLQPQRCAGHRKYTAKSVNEPHKPSATFCKTSAALLAEPQRTAAWTE